jgi:hypothetical protein
VEAERNILKYNKNSTDMIALCLCCNWGLTEVVAQGSVAGCREQQTKSVTAAAHVRSLESDTAITSNGMCYSGPVFDWQLFAYVVCVRILRTRRLSWSEVIRMAERAARMGETHLTFRL